MLLETKIPKPFVSWRGELASLNTHSSIHLVIVARVAFDGDFRAFLMHLDGSSCILLQLQDRSCIGNLGRFGVLNAQLR